MIKFGVHYCPADNTLSRAAMQALCSRLAARVLAHGAGSSSCTALGRRQVLPGAPLACGMATMVRPPSVRDAQVRIFGWAQPDTRRGEGRQGHAPMKTLEKMKRRGLIGQKVRARTRAAAWQRLHAFPLSQVRSTCMP